MSSMPGRRNRQTKKVRGKVMKSVNNCSYGIGALLMLLGGSGLAEIETSNHGCFWLCAVMFSVGIGFCIWSYKK